MEALLAMAIILPFGIFLEFWYCYVGARENRPPAGHCAAVLVFLCTSAGALALLGLPSVVDIHPENWDKELNLLPLAPILKNPAGDVKLILSFVPFGFLWPLAWQETARKTIAAAAGWALCIELLQLLNWRTTSLNDWLLNVLGAALGCALFHALRPRWKALQIKWDAPARLRREKLFCVLLPWVSQFVFFPCVTGGLTSFSFAG